MRRGTFAIAAFLVELACAPCAFAQAYPAKAIRMIMPFAPGGGLEAQARVVTAKLAETWCQPVVIDSRPGANGVVGTQMVVAATPDC